MREPPTEKTAVEQAEKKAERRTRVAEIRSTTVMAASRYLAVVQDCYWLGLRPFLVL